MNSKSAPVQFCSAPLAILLVLASVPLQAGAQTVSVDPAKMPRVMTLDQRFLSYNIEMAEVTGGNFWKPYHSKASTAEIARKPAQSAATPAGMDPNMYQYRPPINLSNPRLRKLALALGPAYIRVSGTWANSVYFASSENPPSKPPLGFDGVLTRKEWKGVIDFVHAVNGELVTSFASSVGTRNAEGVWSPKEASAWLAYTKSIGGKIAAAEFMNEPTYAAMGGAPKSYNAADYGRDIAVFGPSLKQNSPGTIFLGPGSVGEGPFAIEMGGMLSSEDLLRATGPVFDVFSYHLYAAASQRCASMGGRSRPQRQPRSPRNGFLVLRRSTNTMHVFAIVSNLENLSGSPKQRMPPAEAIPGLRRSSIRFVIWLSMPVWHVEASRSSCTTRLRQRLRPARPEHFGTPPELLGERTLAQADGRERS